MVAHPCAARQSPLAPPCIRHRALPLTAGERRDCPNGGKSKLAGEVKDGRALTRAASGHATAAPPSSVMKSRRRPVHVLHHSLTTNRSRRHRSEAVML